MIEMLQMAVASYFFTFHHSMAQISIDILIFLNIYEKRRKMEKTGVI